MKNKTLNITLVLAIFSLIFAFSQAFASPGGHNEGNVEEYVADYSFTLETQLRDGKMVFVGVGGEFDGVVNPTLEVEHDAIIEITLVNGDGIEHDLAFPDFEAGSEHTFAKGDSTVFAFAANKEGEIDYYCTIPGHRIAGMEGLIVVTEG